MKKISLHDDQEPSPRPWSVGDLVKINIRELDVCAHSDTGIIVSVETGRFYNQVEMFPMIRVFNLKTSQVNKIYSYNLEILSPYQ